VVRLSRLSRAASRAVSGVHRCGPALVWSASASAVASASLSSAVSDGLRGRAAIFSLSTRCSVSHASAFLRIASRRLRTCAAQL
jgi:hypothetical protein